MTKTKKQLAQEIQDQWKKFDDAQAEGKPLVALMQIDRKLVRLENELLDLELRNQEGTNE